MFLNEKAVTAVSARACDLCDFMPSPIPTRADINSQGVFPHGDPREIVPGGEFYVPSFAHVGAHRFPCRLKQHSDVSNRGVQKAHQKSDSNLFKHQIGSILFFDELRETVHSNNASHSRMWRHCMRIFAVKMTGIPRTRRVETDGRRSQG